MIEDTHENWENYTGKILESVIDFIANDIKIAESSGKYPSDKDIRNNVKICGEMLNLIDMQDIFLDIIDALPNSYKYSKYIDIWLYGKDK